MEARGVISISISFPSSSFLGLKIALVCRLTAELVNPLLTCLHELVDIFFSLHRKQALVEGGSRKSRTGSGAEAKYLRGASWRNARAAEVGREMDSCVQLRVRERVAIVRVLVELW